MHYEPKISGVLCVLPHGSRLYGTVGPASDYDFKVIFLPKKQDLLMGRPLKVTKHKFDENGFAVGDNRASTPGSYEAEHIPVQKFVDDYVDGQAYAVEIVFGVVHGFHKPWLEKRSQGGVVNQDVADFEKLCDTLATRFVHSNMTAMTGFALKQTFDYVRRGERLEQATKVFIALTEAIDFTLEHMDTSVKSTPIFRMDSPMKDYGTVFDYIVKTTDTPVSEVTAHDKKVRSLYLCGRHFTETTPLSDMHQAVNKLIDGYGERVQGTVGKKVDWKSLSHAVRVYQQVVEMLTTGTITFPRPNITELRAIKEGHMAMEDVKTLLRELDDAVLAEQERTTLPKVTEAFREEVDQFMTSWIMRIYE